MEKPHPGTILERDYLRPLGLTTTRAASVLGVTRQTLDALVNGRSAVSVQMSLRLAKAFDTSPEYWLSLQTSYDIERAKGSTDLSAVKVIVGRPRF